jgi:hypothetical protein
MRKKVYHLKNWKERAHYNKQRTWVPILQLAVLGKLLTL